MNPENKNKRCRHGSKETAGHTRRSELLLLAALRATNQRRGQSHPYAHHECRHLRRPSKQAAGEPPHHSPLSRRPVSKRNPTSGAYMESPSLSMMWVSPRRQLPRSGRGGGGSPLTPSLKLRREKAVGSSPAVSPRGDDGERKESPPTEVDVDDGGGGGGRGGSGGDGAVAAPPAPPTPPPAPPVAAVKPSTQLLL